MFTGAGWWVQLEPSEAFSERSTMVPGGWGWGKVQLWTATLHGVRGGGGVGVGRTEAGVREPSQKISAWGTPASWAGLGEGEDTPVGNQPRRPWGPSEGHAKAQSIKGDMARGALGFRGHLPYPNLAVRFKGTRCEGKQKSAFLCSLTHPVHPHVNQKFTSPWPVFRVETVAKCGSAV